MTGALGRLPLGEADTVTFNPSSFNLLSARPTLTSSSLSSILVDGWDGVEDDTKPFNFASTTAFKAAVIFSMVGGDSFFLGDNGFTGVNCTQTEGMSFALHSRHIPCSLTADR